MEKQELKFLLEFSSPRVSLHPLTGNSRIARNFERISTGDETQKPYLVCLQCKALLTICLGSQSNLYRHLELHEKDSMQTSPRNAISGELVEDIPLRYLKRKISPKSKDSGNAMRHYVVKNREMKRHSDGWHYKSLYLQK